MNNDDKFGDDGEEQLELGPEDNWPSGNQRFAELEENEEFEESDRDSDYAAIYTEVEEEEPDFPDENSEEQLEFLESPEESQAWEDEEEPSNDAWENNDSWEEETVTASEPEPFEKPTEDTWTALSALREEEQDFQVRPADTDPEEPWEEEAFEDQEQREINFPLGMIVVGIIALVLLGAGGYGVMQDRSALQDQIRQLQASLATTASPAEVAETRSSSQATASLNRELEQQVADLSRENRSLQSIVAGLETQLQAQQEALAKSKAPPPAPKPAPAAPAPKPAPAPQSAISETGKEPLASAPTTPATTGTWFVNFSSYSQRPTAEAWTGRLKPAAGDVVVTTGEKSGRTFYRVRVINLASEEEANRIARTLEQDYKLPRLWVGRSP